MEHVFTNSVHILVFTPQCSHLSVHIINMLTTGDVYTSEMFVVKYVHNRSKDVHSLSFHSTRGAKMTEAG